MFATDTTSAPPLARATDPATSRLAAAQLSPEALSIQKAAIVELLTEHPRDDRELTVAYFNLAESRGWPVTDFDSIRKRRSQLTQAGKVIAVGTHVGRLHREVNVWGVNPNGSLAEAKAAREAKRTGWKRVEAVVSRMEARPTEDTWRVLDDIRTLRTILTEVSA
jgi:hypothetical protein